MGPYQRDEKIILTVAIWGGDNREHITTAMVDCVVTENFIDKEYAEWNRIPLNEKTVPRRVLAMDGWEVASAPVTHDAVVKLKINNHHETIKLHCITIGNSPIIVRLPWLKRHNPNIDWKEGRVTFNSTRCARECLDASPHATTVAEERSIGQYYQDTTQDTTHVETAYGTAMLDEEEGDQWQDEEETEEVMTREYVEKTIQEWGQDDYIEETIWEYGQDNDIEEPMMTQQGGVQDNPLRIQSPETIRTTTAAPEPPRRFNLPLRTQLPETIGTAVAPPETPRRPNLQGGTEQPSLSARDIVLEEYHNYLHVFEGKDDLGWPPHRHHDHRIPLLEGNVPPFEPLRALDEGRLWTLREYLAMGLEWGWIRSSMSPAGAPIHLVKKKDGTLRLCVDYRGLNAMMVKDRTLLPLIGEALDRLSCAKVYTKLDVKDAYHNLRIAKGDEWKMAFRTKYGLYEYLVMPFGLTNAPASFQRWMNEVLSDYLDVFCIAYLEDILIYSDNIEQHRQHVKMILERVEEVGLELKASKCEFHTDRTEYLGYIISPSGIQMDLEKVRAVAEWRELTGVKGVQSFLGFANFYRRFIRDFSKITTPLTRLTRKDTPWEWDNAAQSAFEQLKRAMVSEPILRHFDPAWPLTLETDASDYAIGAVCSHLDDANMIRPLGYFSRKLKDAELNYDIHDKELLAIINALNKWSTYCKSMEHKITILSDHKNLEYWQMKKDLNLRQARWAEQLANYDFAITYRTSKLAGKLDIVSRDSGDSPWEGEMKHRQNRGRILLPSQTFWISSAEVMELQVDRELLEEIRGKTAEDPEVQAVILKLQKGERRDSRVALGLCEERDGLLMYGGLIWIPNNDQLRLRLLYDHHDALVAGHPGWAKTLELLSRNYYWPQQRQYVNRYVDHCDTCKRIKLVRHTPFGLLRPLQLPKWPWDSISIDFIMGLPPVGGCNAL
jgi:hypothetical protein